MNIKKEIGSNKVNLLVIPSGTYSESLVSFIKKFDKQKISYIALNKSYKGLTESFKARNVRLDNFLFVDCVTKMLMTPEKKPNCVFVPSPKDIKTISLCINRVMDPYFKVIVVDSLSNLIVYHKPSVVVKFVHDLANRMRAKEKGILILIIATKDKGTSFFEEIEMLVDKVVELSPNKIRKITNKENSKSIP